MKNPQPVDEHAETQVLDERSRVPSVDEKTQQLPTLSEQDLERLLKSDKPAE
jgi:hypothetical protein